jgi:hypothetical protein
VSDLFGTQDLGTLYAADYEAGDVVCFTYDQYFAWADYSAPGPYIYDNTAEIVETGQSASARLVVNWLDEELLVEKTATSYLRTHEWDIDKWVTTEFGHTIGEEEYPKIWLYQDGSGDETATWNVCVTYLGYEDYDFNGLRHRHHYQHRHRRCGHHRRRGPAVRHGDYSWTSA